MKKIKQRAIYIFDGNENLVAVFEPEASKNTYFNAVHSEELNGSNTFSFSIPSDHENAGHVVEGGWVSFSDLDDNFQYFEIKNVIERHGDELTKDVICEHSSYELLDEFILSASFRNETPENILTSLLDGTRWDVGDVEVTDSINFSTTRRNVLDTIKRLLDRTDSEVRYRVEFSGSTIINRYIDLLEERGERTGKRFVYSKDIERITRDLDTFDLKTALYGFGQSQEVPSGTIRVTFEGVEWSTAQGDPLNKPLGQAWLGDAQALAQFGRAGGTRHRFGAFDSIDSLDPESLLNSTYDALQESKEPRINYSLAVIDLEIIAGLEHEKVRLGDTVSVIDREFDPPLIVETRNIRLDINLSEPERTNIVLGNFAQLITDDAQVIRETQEVVNERQGVWKEAGYRGNLINDPSFELVQETGTADIYNVFDVDTTARSVGALHWWNYRGANPEILLSPFIDDVEGSSIEPIYGQKSAVISDESEFYQYIPLFEGVFTPYTFSVYVSSYGDTGNDGKARLEIWATESDGTRISLIGGKEINLRAGEDFQWKRLVFTAFNVTPSAELIEIVITTEESNFKYIASGSQAVALDSPTTFVPDDALYRFLLGERGLNYLGYGLDQPNVSGARLFLAENQAVPAGSIEVVKFEVAEFDNQDEVNTTSFQFIPDRTGTWFFTCSAFLDNPVNARLGIYLNGTPVRQFGFDSSSNLLNGTIFQFILAGTVVDFRVRNDQTTNIIQDNSLTFVEFVKLA